MSTRGLIGLVIDGQLKATYNHSDSYPEGLGADALVFAATLSVQFERVLDWARRLRVVTDADPIPNPLGYQLAQLVDTSVGRSIGGGEPVLPDSPSWQEWSGELSWYQVLRGAQGDLGKYLRAGYMEDGSAFANESLFCEWGYVIDLDRKRFETYRGFVTAPHTDGRFGKGDTKPADWAPGYAGDQFWYPIRLVMDYRLDSLDTVERYVATVTEAAAKQEEDEKAVAQ